MNKFVNLIILSLVVAPCTGCREQDLSNGRNPRTTYGLDSIEVEKQLELKETPSKMAFSFLCTKTSSDYQFRLYYPLVPPAIEFLKYRESSLDKMTEAEQKILTSLIGLKFELVEDFSGKSVAMWEVWSPFSRDNNMVVNIGNNSPASTWLASSVRLKKGKWYKIIVTLPAKGDTEEMFLKPILAGGITIPVYL